MAVVAWNDGMYIVGKPYSIPTMSGTSVASHIMEHPINYDGRPEHMLMALGASLWVRNGPRFYAHERAGLRFDDVVTSQLENVIKSMAILGRLTDDPPKLELLDDETEDCIWSILMRAAADDHVLTGDSQIVPLAGWLRAGAREAIKRWGPDLDTTYAAFVSAANQLTDIVLKYKSGEIPKHRKFSVNIRARLGKTDIAISG